MKHSGVAPSLIFGQRALSETRQVLCQHDEIVQGNSETSTTQDIEYACHLVKLATECLRIGCASGNLEMLAVDPGTGERHELPSEYFDRPSSSAVFNHGTLDLSGLENGDPIKSALGYANAWTCGFVEREFREWLVDRKVGPLAGPELRPYFHLSDFTPDIQVGIGIRAAMQSGPEPNIPKQKSTPPSRLKPFWNEAEAEIMHWLRENGCPALGDGGQANLERFVANWLADHGYGEEASEPTIRRHVRNCMNQYRQEVGSLDGAARQ